MRSLIQRIFATVCFTAILFYGPAAHALIITSTPGSLLFELLEGHGATSTLEFGLGTPSPDSTQDEREVIFVIHLIDEEVGTVTSSAAVKLGIFPAGTTLDFYNRSDFGGISWAFSSHLTNTPTATDRETFTDRNNSLGLGGSAVEQLSPTSWLLHLDDAASVDDDDNEMIIRVSVHAVPEPAGILLVGMGFGALACAVRFAKQRAGAVQTPWQELFTIELQYPSRVAT